jgi:hypothetical protein
MFALPTNITSHRSIVSKDTTAVAAITYLSVFALLPGATPVDIRVGWGRLIEDGDKVTIQYRVTDTNKKEFANTMKRGMPFTLLYGDRNSDPLVSVVLDGMRIGGSRYVEMPASALPTGVGSIVPSNTDLTIWVHVIAAKKVREPKVESAHAERAQGAVEVPRATARYGAARP